MELNKDKRYLFICESPEKSRTITKIFKDAGYKNVVVQATIGHFTKIADGSGYHNTGIDPKNNFKINYQLDSSKKDNINKLKEQVKFADQVILAGDLDREGEAICWECREFLKIPKSKYVRVKYNAINKAAIFEAIEKAGDINDNLVNAAHSRGCLDKMVGYRLSGIARNSVNCKSVGRCQSAALKLIVEREEEILNFKPEKYIDLYLHFEKNKSEFKAKYQGTDDKPIKQLKTQKQVDDIYNDCKQGKFIVKSVEHRDKNENPKPPFCTATFQQECATKLGLSSKQAMDCAQKLFEAGKISYHRTDLEALEEDFANKLKKYALKVYGKDYASGTIRVGKSDAQSQEAHEGLHILDLDLTPEKFAEDSSSDLLTKVYRIIYNRTIACALKPAIIAETTYNIYNNQHKFTMTSNELIFDGYRKVYAYKDESDEKEELIKETFNENEELKNCSLESIPMETKPRPRFKEAAFLKELKERGIGRPSTYATIIETILSESRGYVVVDKKELVPTDKGIKLSHFLDEKFPDIINIEYTKEMEKSLDQIANGKLNYLDFLQNFYEKLEESASKVDKTGQVSEQVCPECGKPLVYRKGKFGNFLGCSGYPACRFIQSLNKK